MGSIISAINKQNKQSFLVTEQKLKIQYSKMRIVVVVVALAVLFVVSESTGVVQGSNQIVDQVQSAAQQGADTAEQIAQQWADQAEAVSQNLVDQGQQFVGQLAAGWGQALNPGA